MQPNEGNEYHDYQKHSISKRVFKIYVTLNVKNEHFFIYTLMMVVNFR